MTRPKRLLSLVVVLVAGAIVFAIIKGPKAPRFVKETKVNFPSDAKIFHVMRSFNPIRGDKLWLGAMATNRVRYFLFDAARREIAGELIDAVPACLNGDGTKAICRQRSYYKYGSLHRARDWLTEVSSGLLNARSPRETETLWLVDITKGTKVKLGRIAHRVGSIFEPVPSPDGHYAFAISTGDLMYHALYLCDFATSTLSMVNESGIPLGWWNERQILLSRSGTEYVLYDIQTRHVNTLVDESRIAEFCKREQIANGPFGLTFARHAPNPEVYLIFDRESPQWFRLEQPGGALKRTPCPKEFGQLDRSSRFWLSIAPDSGEICLQDLLKNVLRLLVPYDETSFVSTPAIHDHEQGYGRPSGPIFYGDSVIYIRSNQLWQVDFQGSNNVLLFRRPN